MLSMPAQIDMRGYTVVLVPERSDEPPLVYISGQKVDMPPDRAIEAEMRKRENG